MHALLISVACLCGVGGFVFAMATIFRKLGEEELLKITALTTASKLLGGAAAYLEDMEAIYHDECERALGFSGAQLTAAEAHRTTLWLKHFIGRSELNDPAVEIRVENLERSLPTRLVVTSTGSFYPYIFATLMAIAILAMLFAPASRKQPGIWWLVVFIIPSSLGFSIAAIIRTRFFIALRKVRRSAEASLHATPRRGQPSI